MSTTVLLDVENTPGECERQLPVGFGKRRRIQGGTSRKGRFGREFHTNKKRKIKLDEANEKRNTWRRYEVGYVSSSLPIGAAFSDATPARITNHSRTLS